MYNSLIFLYFKDILVHITLDRTFSKSQLESLSSKMEVGKGILTVTHGSYFVKLSVVFLLQITVI